MQVGVACKRAELMQHTQDAPSVFVRTNCPTIPANETWPTVDADFEQYDSCVDFSYPYYIGGWALMSQINTGETVDYIPVRAMQSPIADLGPSAVSAS
jgi:hypothetical protein